MYSVGDTSEGKSDNLSPVSEAPSESEVFKTLVLSASLKSIQIELFKVSYDYSIIHWIWTIQMACKCGTLHDVNCDMWIGNVYRESQL